MTSGARSIPTAESRRGLAWVELARTLVPWVMYALLAFILVEALIESWLVTTVDAVLTDPTWIKSVRNLCYVGLAILTLAHILLHGSWKSFATGADVALMVLVAVLLAAGLIGGSSPVLTMQAIFVYLRAAAVFYAIRALNPPWPRVRIVLVVVGGLIALNAAASVVQLVVGPRAYMALGWADLTWAAQHRAQGMQEHPNHLGHILGLMALGTVAWIVVVNRVRARWWMFYGLLAAGLASAQSRESLLASVVGIGIVAALGRMHLRRAISSVVVLVALVAATWATDPAVLAQLSRRIEGVFTAVALPAGSEGEPVCDPNEENCTASGLPPREARILFAQQAVRIWLGSPWIGYGVGQFGGAVAFEDDPEWYLDPRFGPAGFRLYGLEGKQVDSFWIHLLVEVGIIGSAAYLAWLSLLVLPCIRAARRLRGVGSGAAPWWLPSLLLVPAAVAFAAVVAFLSPALEDPLLPPLLFGIIGLGWLAIQQAADTTDGAPPLRA